ncbi:hypothetical protein L288_20740 [Sphingobium quisquiliarum P25]|uniref:Nuclease n=1 Tax=Sphingobium quisquiliarum P25 TaxID=1329909 RepID=T0HKS5_9SPHN|nr:hypothetical protein [Sphingobium quisquiliarum]EQA98193.1 hypothetical protein L288_20740 [Sphingobium quisquiliarum P25]
MNKCSLLVPAIFVLFGFAAPAAADPCEGPLPKQPGATFGGTIRYVGDGDSLCVGRTNRPEEWIEVRLADFNAPELHGSAGEAAKQTLTRIAFGRSVLCRAERGRSERVISFDRVIARCQIDGRSLGDAMRAAGVAEGGH